MKTFAKHPHLGRIIAKMLHQRGMSKAEFGRRIQTSRQNVSLILEKRSFDTDLLWRVGQALEKDFFALLSFQQSGPNPEQGLVEMRLEFANQRLILLTTEKDDIFQAEQQGIDLPFRPGNDEEDKEGGPESAAS